MLSTVSHQPEVSRLLHQEHVARLAGDAQQPVATGSLTPPRHPRTSRLAGLAHAALDVTHRRLPTRT
jgi:hypothetical protein